MAKDTIGSMVAVVSATASQFAQDIQSAESSVTHFKRHVEQSSPQGGMASFLGGNAFAAFRTGGAIAAGMAAFNATVNAAKNGVANFYETIERAEALSDFADQLGIATTALQELQFVANMGGSSQQKIESGIERMVKRIGEAREGAIEARAAFEALGLNVDALASMSADQAFREIADAVSQVSNATDQAVIVSDIFGKANASLLNVLRRGRQGIDELAQSGRNLSAVMSGEMVSALADSHNKVKEATAAWQGMKNEWALTAKPLGDALTNVKKGFADFSRTVAIAVREGQFGPGIDIRPDKDLHRQFDSIFGVRGKMGQQLAHIESFRAAWVQAMKDAGNNADAASKKVASATNPIAEWKRKAEEAAKLQKEIDEMMKRGADVAKSVRTPWEVFADTVEDLNKLLKVGAINWATFDRAVAKAGDELERATELKEQMDRMSATPGVAAVQQGSTAAFSAIQASVRAQADGDRRRQEYEKKQLEQATRQTKLQEEIKRALERGHKTLQGASI